MVESLMYFAIGALMASLGAIALLPALWRRAVRLTRRDLQATLPITPAEISAQRDQIRAAAAVEQRRLEQRSEGAEAALGAAQTEIGEHVATIQQREATIQACESDIATLRADLSRRIATLAERDDTIAMLEQERNNLVTNLSASRISNQALDQESINLRQAAEQRQARIEEQDRQITGLLDKIAEIQNVSSAMRLELQQRNEELRAAARTHRELTARISIIERKIVTAETIAEETSALLTQAQEDRNRLAGELSQSSQEREARRSEAAALSSRAERLAQRVTELETLHERNRTQHLEIVRDLTRSVDTLRQEKRQMGEEISTMRFELSRQVAQKSRRRTAKSEGDRPATQDV